MSADEVLNEIKDAGSVVLKTSLDESREQILRHALATATQFNAIRGGGKLRRSMPFRLGTCSR